jgi:DNA mismatch endonuclease, patch repair protein
MTDVLTPSQRSFCMSRIQGRDTSPELRLRRSLWRLGLRYSLRRNLPGKPDLTFPRHKAVLFVDGCFWHSCPEHSVRPRTNSAFWNAKLQANARRDREVNAKLAQLGWRVVRVWEHEVKDNVELAAVRSSKKIRPSRRTRRWRE